MVRTGGAGGLGDAAITALHAFGSKGLRPDLTILLEVNEANVAARLAERDGEVSDAIGGRSADYHRSVASSFKALADADPDGFAVVNGDGDPSEVHARVLEALAPLLAKEKRAL